MTIKIIAIALSISIFVFVIELVRQEKLTFKYAAVWLLFSLIGIVFSIFNQWLFQLSSWFGFELPSNFIFFSLLGMFVFLSLLLTVFLCQQNERNDKMAQKIGLMELELNRLKDKENNF